MKIFRNEQWYIWGITHADGNGGFFTDIFCEDPERMANDSTLVPKAITRTKTFATAAEADAEAELTASAIQKTGGLPWIYESA